jgi:hypothetical protein
MRIANPHWAPAVAMAVLALLALTGCQSTPTPVPTSTATADAPVFASDEEALAAATEAYAAYLKASDESWSGGSTTREEFLSLSTGKAHEDDVAANKLFMDRGWRKVGTATFDSMQLQSSNPHGGGWEIRVYVCVDVKNSDVVDSSGISVAKPDRPLRMPLEVALVAEEGDQSNLLISESRTWSGSNFC